MGENKCYPYSVKECLKSFFGDDPLEAMRHLDPDKGQCYDNQRPVKHIPMCWRGADQKVFEILRENTFLTDTVLTDDYIAYMLRRGDEDQVFLVFMTDKDDPAFRLDAEYAKQLETEWRRKGYRPILIHICVAARYHDKHRYTIDCYDHEPEGAYFYTTYETGGKTYLVMKYLSGWETLYRKALSAINSLDTEEYECIFDPKIRIKKGICEDIPGLLKYFKKHGPVKAVLEKMKFSDTYRRQLLCGGQILNIHVNQKNLICQIDLEAPAGKMIPDENFAGYGRLITRLPVCISVRPLDPVRMHAYAIQTVWSDDSVRNYYLKTFDTMEIPENCELSGCSFTKETLFSVRLESEQNVAFENGMTVPRHILFNYSYRQVDIEKPELSYGNPEGLEIRTIFRLPIKDWKGSPWPPQYWGRADEIVGPCEPWIDKNGNRISDIAIRQKDHLNYTLDAWPVRVEPTGKYGFLKRDGSWLAPPVFDTIDNQADGYVGCMLAYIGTGKERTQYLICAGTGAKQCGCVMDSGDFTWALCPFNAMPDGETYYYPWDPCAYYDSEPEIKFGKWGLMNDCGEIIVEPCYDVFYGFFEAWEHEYQYYAIVGRKTEDGKVLLGVMNDRGELVIPCEYYDIHWRFGDAFIFRKTEEDEYGVMNFEGKVLVGEQKLWQVYELHEEYGVIEIGRPDDAFGVYSIERQEMIIPQKYYSIDYGKTYICCDNEYYDYNGNLLTKDGVIKDSDRKGLFELWKDGTMQLIRSDGSVVSDPEPGKGTARQKKYTKKGFSVFESGKYKLKGLTDTDGNILIPPEYSRINIQDNLILAEKTVYSSNLVVSESLFMTDGTPVLQGCFRHMRDENAEWCAVDNFFTFDTPLGEEYCRIIDHEAIRKKQDFNSRNADYLKAVRERKVPAAYLMNAYYSRIKPCATKQEKDAARRSIAAEIEKTFPLKG